MDNYKPLFVYPDDNNIYQYADLLVSDTSCKTIYESINVNGNNDGFNDYYYFLPHESIPELNINYPPVLMDKSIALPSYEELIVLAREQVGERVISQKEKQYYNLP